MNKMNMKFITQTSLNSIPRSIHVKSFENCEISAEEISFFLALL